MIAMDEKVHFFNSSKDFRRWLMKNHKTKVNIWIGFYKKSFDQNFLSQSEALDQCLCFGWVYGKLKSIDYQSYKINFVKRKNKSIWSVKTVKRFKVLKKDDLVHESGLLAFKNRNVEQSKDIQYEWAPRFLKEFKKNKIAWEFFNNQSKSYIKYMKSWVMGAKREETQEKRFKELLEDSSHQTKLKRILAMIEKYKPQYELGKTPIEAGKNIGAMTGAELRSIGIDTLEKLEKIGWEDAFRRLCETHPHRINLNMLTSLIGAIEKQNWKTLDQNLKVEAKQFMRSLKREFEDFF